MRSDFCPMKVYPAKIPDERGNRISRDALAVRIVREKEKEETFRGRIVIKKVSFIKVKRNISRDEAK